MPRLLLLALALAGCGPDPCEGSGALADCLAPTKGDDWYVAQSHAYFDTMDYEPVGTIEPAYSELVARWEWPPWLKLTGYTREQMVAGDALLALLPSVVKERDCRAFDEQPFGRCRVVFYYDSHDGRPCPIYEEFTFNDAGEITFIEAWSDLPGLRPMASGDPWAEAGDVGRLATRIPGLGRPAGTHAPLDGEEMTAAAAADPDVQDFTTRAEDWLGTWLAEVEASGGDAMWEQGCGWGGTR